MDILTTTPQLTGAEKTALHDWLLGVLVAENYCQDVGEVYYILPKLALHSTVGSKGLASNNYWAIQDHKIYIGYQSRREIPLRDCLQVLLALTGFVASTEALEKVKTQALLTHVLGEAKELHKAGLIEAPLPMEGLAFSEEQVAALLGGEWMLPNGEVVDVSQGDWKVCATRLPVARAAMDAVADGFVAVTEAEDDRVLDEEF